MWGQFDTAPDADGSVATARDVALVLSELGHGEVPPGRARRRLALDGLSPGSKASPSNLLNLQVEGIELTPLECLQLLTRLPAARPGIPSAVSPSLAVWAQAARLALELVVRQRFIPRIESKGDRWYAAWRPVLSDGADGGRVATVTKALPGAALSLSGDRPPRALIEDFLSALLDAGVRAACAGARLEESAPQEGVGGAWARALFSADAWVENGSVAAVGKLERLVEAWAAPVAVRSSFRTCLRLDPPTIPEAAAPMAAPPQGWRLHYALQSMEDPSLLVPAEAVWFPGPSNPFKGWGLANPHELLLQGLGVASRVWPTIGHSLDTATPCEASLTADEAERFSREVAPRLAEAGLGVLLPGIRPLLSALQATLRAKAKTDPSDTGDGPSRFGLEALIEFDFRLAIEGEPLTPEEMETLVALKSPLVRIRGQWVAIGPGDLDRARRLWHRRKELSLREVLEIAGEGAVDGVKIESVEADGWLSALFGARPEGGFTVQPPPGLKANLRPYQLRGLAWLLTMRRTGLGALLADDMGLGKTLQVLACELASRHGRASEGPTLVVCPSSVATNWRIEAGRFTPSLRVIVHHGPERAKGRAFEHQAKSHDLIVTTYALLLRDQAMLSRVSWSNIVLDEAQNVKNPFSQQAQAARALRAGWRVAMTGTPVENRLAELWSIYHFLNPGYLSSLHDFRRKYAVPVERYRDEDAAAQLTRLVRPFLIRRLKTDPAVAKELPEKIESNTFVPLTREQATLYEGVVRDALDRVEQATGIERRGIVLSMLTRLKQVCNHPAHFLADNSRLERRSGKLERLVEMIEEAMEEGDRCLVFTQFREMGDLLRKHLSERFGDVPFLHGGTPRTGRDAMVARFQSGDGPALFLLSLKAGGTGLNLTAANRVFHFDRWWNPAVEDQATDRAYRLGQHRNVQVHKFVCVGTLEEKIDEALRDKRALADRIVGAGEAWITELSTRDLRELVALRPDAVEEG